MVRDDGDLYGGPEVRRRGHRLGLLGRADCCDCDSVLHGRLCGPVCERGETARGIIVAEWRLHRVGTAVCGTGDAMGFRRALACPHALLHAESRLVQYDLSQAPGRFGARLPDRARLCDVGMDRGRMGRESPLQGGEFAGPVLRRGGGGLGSWDLQLLPSAHAATGKRRAFEDGRTLWVGDVALFQEAVVCDFHGGFSPGVDGNDALLGPGQSLCQLLGHRTFRSVLHDGADGRARRARGGSAGLYQALRDQVDDGARTSVLGAALCALLRGGYLERAEHDDLSGDRGAAPRIQLRLCFCFGVPLRGQARW